MRLDSATRCPKCKSKLSLLTARIECTNESCGLIFNSINGIPVLIEADNEVFNFDKLSSDGSPFFGRYSIIFNWAKKIVPDISHNTASKKVFTRLTTTLLPSNPRVLIIGSGNGGDGIDIIKNFATACVVKTDVYVCNDIDYICDAHDLPFENDTFDLVIIQAVLEHLLNPKTAVDEIHRVLSCEGFVYSEVPFIQQVHGGKFDFTRFTKSGHRYLFKKFSQIEAGQCGGVGMALAWSIEYFIRGLSPNKAVGLFFSIIMRYFTFWLKYLDCFSIGHGFNSNDGASAFYFLGTKSQTAITDLEIVDYYARFN